MSGKRPDSAKSHTTKRTLDSEYTKKQLNGSKFSQTFSSGVNSFYEKPDDFKQYVAEKDKDPKFKHLKPKLEQIPQKTLKPKQNQSNKFASKPFEKKKQSKLVEKINNDKIEEQKKEQETMKLSKGFAQKNKSKMNSLRIVAKSNSKKEPVEEQKQQKPKSKINFDNFKVNIPGKSNVKKVEVKETKQQDKQQQSSPKKMSIAPSKQKKTDQQLKRQKELNQLQRYISDIESKNIENFPGCYDEFIDKIDRDDEKDLEKININDFLQQKPTERDYERLKKKIYEFDEQIENQNTNMSNSTSKGIQEESIDLDDIIESSADRESEIFLSSISSQDLKKRNLFLTQILKGKISQDQIKELDEMDKSTIKMHRLESQEKEEDEQIEMMEINMIKKKSNRLMDRNRIEAFGEVYRDCDYLSQEHQKRLEELLNGNIDPSPFQFNEMETIRNRSIDQGIRMYRELANSIQNCQQVLSESMLPKDPNLKSQAQKKILKQKIKNINQRLMDLDNIIINKSKIDNIVKKHQDTKPSKQSEQFLKQKRKQFEEQIQKLQDAEQMLNTLGNKENVKLLVNQIQRQSQELQRQLIMSKEIDQKQLKKREKEKLVERKRKIKQVEDMSKELQQQLNQMENIKNQVEQRLRTYEQFQMMECHQLICQGYKQNQTLEDIDSYISKKCEGQSYLDKPQNL